MNEWLVNECMCVCVCVCVRTGFVFEWVSMSYSFSRCKLDSTLVYNYSLLSVQQFSIEAFQFIASHPVVYIHCDAIVCHNSTKLSRCSQGCVPGPGLGRKRRELGPEFRSSSTHYVVSEGPLRFDAESSEDKGKGVQPVSWTDAIRCITWASDN